MGMGSAREKNAPALRSPVSWALLGLVIERASYGYELVHRFERTYGDALPLSSASQIYTSLDSLVGRALIEAVPGTGESSETTRQPRPHYRATDAGVTSYQEWLIAQAHDERRRSRLFARQLAVLAPAAALQVIERYEQVCLKHASETPLSPAEDVPHDAISELAERLVAEEDRQAIGSKLSWIEYARREFRVLSEGRVPRR